MTAAASLRAALGTGYRHTMRLVLLNSAVGAVAACLFVVELAFLPGRARLAPRRVESLIAVP